MNTGVLAEQTAKERESESKEQSADCGEMPAVQQSLEQERFKAMGTMGPESMCCQITASRVAEVSCHDYLCHCANLSLFAISVSFG